jgi:hypothetical protein
VELEVLDVDHFYWVLGVGGRVLGISL